jgi:hypothetical protein
MEEGGEFRDYNYGDSQRNSRNRNDEMERNPSGRNSNPFEENGSRSDDTDFEWEDEGRYENSEYQL